MIILWITRRKDKDAKTVASEKTANTPETTPDVKAMLTGQGDTLAPVHVARLNQHTRN